MSEFSESYHLLTTDREDGVNLLLNASLAGFVFPQANGWVTLLAEGEMYAPNTKLVEANSGYLLHYFFGEDDGWGFELFYQDQVVSGYDCYWSESLIIRDNNLALDPFKNIIFQKEPGKIDALQDLFLSAYDNGVDPEIACRFSDIIGLVYYRWLSYDILRQDNGAYISDDGEKAKVLNVKGM